MICYLDRTFCRSNGCTNQCGRQLTQEIVDEAIKFGLPIASGSFCEQANLDDAQDVSTPTPYR